MTALEKAEHLVREHPANKELMELERGAEVHNGREVVAISAVRDGLFYSCCFLHKTQKDLEEKGWKTLGKPAHLEHYLRVLRKTGLEVYISAYNIYCKWEKPCHESVVEKCIVFNLTTGKPATEKDAEEFIKLVENV